MGTRKGLMEHLTYLGETWHRKDVCIFSIPHVIGQKNSAVLSINNSGISPLLSTPLSRLGSVSLLWA
jgi:hypothetical protein